MLSIAPSDITFDSLTQSEQVVYIRAHKAAFVGQVLIGVLSTGIYCLPSCSAREPKTENVRLFRTEAEAQAAGLRPCRRCHPDYFYRDYDPDLERLTALVETLQRDPASVDGLDAMAAVSGIGVTKLSALFRQHYHATPAAFLNRVRLVAACQLLTDPTRQVIEVAYAVGYESLSAFHDNFRKSLGLSPGDYQHLGQRPGKEDSFTLTLPDNSQPGIAFSVLSRDPDSLIEQVNGTHAIKALAVAGTPLLLHMTWADQAIQCRVESSVPLDPAAMRAVHAAAIRLLGFATNPAGFERLVSADPRLAPLIAGRQGLRIPLNADVFEGVAWAIIGQQINLPFAYKLRQRLTQLCGQVVNERFIAHPTPEAVAQLDYEDLTTKQYSRKKAEYLIDTARLIASGALVIAPGDAASQVEKRLLAVRGLGPWSTHYIMMRALGFADCVPLGDTGLTSALQRFFALEKRPDAVETARLMQPFAPYRSLATYHLWASLGVTPA